MSRNALHMIRDGDVLILSRRPGLRAAGPGVWAETRLPLGLRASTLAHEVRKDVWRALRSLRGLLPVVQIWPCQEAPGLRVRAGGMVTPSPPVVLQTKLQAVLNDRDIRARWIAHARRHPS
ncbi:MAG: hypothetical protein AAGF94_14345 [Pseudomonadota bacterium]